MQNRSCKTMPRLLCFQLLTRRHPERKWRCTWFPSRCCPGTTSHVTAKLELMIPRDVTTKPVLAPHNLMVILQCQWILHNHVAPGTTVRAATPSMDPLPTASNSGYVGVINSEHVSMTRQQAAAGRSVPHRCTQQPGWAPRACTLRSPSPCARR